MVRSLLELGCRLSFQCQHLQLGFLHLLVHRLLVLLLVPHPLPLVFLHRLQVPNPLLLGPHPLLLGPHPQQLASQLLVPLVVLQEQLQQASPP